MLLIHINNSVWCVSMRFWRKFLKIIRQLYIITWVCIRRGSEEGNGKTNGQSDKRPKNQTTNQPEHVLSPHLGLVEVYSDLQWFHSKNQTPNQPEHVLSSHLGLVGFYSDFTIDNSGFRWFYSDLQRFHSENQTPWIDWILHYSDFTVFITLNFKIQMIW